VFFFFESSLLNKKLSHPLITFSISPSTLVAGAEGLVEDPTGSLFPAFPFTLAGQ
jgi:hypothetical protein